MLNLQLLGGLVLRNAEGKELSLSARKEAALLAYLALQNRPVERAAAAELFWPDRAEEQARKSLRQALVSLRRTMADDKAALPADRRDWIALDFNQIWVDARVFGTAIANRDPETAATLYQADLLDGFSEPSGGFGDWLIVERTRFADLACGVFSDLAERSMGERDWETAIAHARRIIQIDPLREHGHCQLMRALNDAGRRNEALQQFHRLSGTLREQLGVQPAPDTAALYTAIKSATSALAVSKDSALAKREGNRLRPGLAVLPLRVTEGGFADENLALSLTEELIGTLAAYRWFFVTSALQALVYRNRDVSPLELADELGVRYVLSGSIQRQGNRLSVRFSVAETQRGEHLWSARHNCYLDEMLEAQDALAREIAGAIEPELLRAESEITLRLPSKDIDRWSHLARARRLADEGQIEQAFEVAANIARSTDNCSYSQATLGWTAWMKYMLGDRAPDLLRIGLEASSNAVQIDSRLFLGHTVKGAILAHMNELDPAVKSIRLAIDLNPSFPVSYNQLISALTRTGQPREALDWIERLDEVSPSDPFRGFYCCVRALTWFFLNNDYAAIANAEESLAAHPGWLGSEIVLAAAACRAGDKRKAAVVAQELIASRGAVTFEQFRAFFRVEREADLHAVADPLRSLGFIVERK
jgi:pentatricopeptide repeat protein